MDYMNAPHFIKSWMKGRLIIAHAGIRSDYIGQYSSKVKTFVLYGWYNGSKHPDGSPVRKDSGQIIQKGNLGSYMATHLPLPEARQVNHTYNIDTGLRLRWKTDGCPLSWNGSSRSAFNHAIYSGKNSGHLLINQKTRHLGEFFCVHDFF